MQSFAEQIIESPAWKEHKNIEIGIVGSFSDLDHVFLQTELTMASRGFDAVHMDYSQDADGHHTLRFYQEFRQEEE